MPLCDSLGHKNAEHRVTLYLPSHRIGSIGLVGLDDGSYAKRHSFSVRFLMIGDSITQGWNSKYDSLSYANRVSRFFNAESIVQGRGGSIYKEETFEKLPDFDPDVVTVAYGVNDFHHYKTLDEMRTHVRAYHDKLKEAYGDKKVMIISPIWFKNREGKLMGRYEDCRALIAAEAEAHGFIHIDGLSFVPPLDEFFTDGLHPNDLGFSLYTENLIREMQKYL
jgi:lysophospholipase L1-like esterase